MKFAECPQELTAVPGYPGVFIQDLSFDELKTLEDFGTALTEGEDAEGEEEGGADERVLEQALWVWQNVLVGSDNKPFEDMQTLEQVRAAKGGVTIMRKMREAMNPKGN